MPHVGLLAVDWVRTHRFQSVLLAIGTLLPLGANVLNELAKAWTAVVAWLPRNPTLPAFGLTATFLGWAVLRYRLLDPRPVAREMLFESMPDPVVVLNEAGVIVDANQAAETVLGEPDRPILGRTIGHVSLRPPRARRWASVGRTCPQVVTLAEVLPPRNGIKPRGEPAKTCIRLHQPAVRPRGGGDD